MKHFKRNIVIAVLGMVFLGGFMGEGAWAAVTWPPTGWTTDTLKNVDHFECLNPSGSGVPYQIGVFNRAGGSVSSRLSGVTFSSEDECKNYANELNAKLTELKRQQRSDPGDSDPDDDDDNVYNRPNGTYENNGGGIASILNFCVGDDGRANIACIIDAVVFTFTTGVGVLGFTGIIIVGIQYLTAAGDAARMTRAKRRMIEIVIGLVLYMFSYSLIRWLSPSYDGTQTIESQLNSQVETVEVGANK